MSLKLLARMAAGCQKTARWPEVTTDITVGQMRAIEFTASELGDWALHCHKSHHTMNPMGHDVPNMIGVSSKALPKHSQPWCQTT